METNHVELVASYWKSRSILELLLKPETLTNTR